jgi:hypothetical protein
MEQIYTTVLWRTCVAYCLGWCCCGRASAQLHRLDALYREVRVTDQYEREWPLNRVECCHAGAKERVLVHQKRVCYHRELRPAPLSSRG